ncbi:MAG: YHS domain protein [bacterium]|nr:YHS domain protein [bacterium]
MNSKLIKIGGPVLVVLLIAVGLFARSQNLAPISLAYNPIAQPMFSDLALDGYDPVAYFTRGAPTPGDAQFSYRWNEADWRFASKEHLQMFQNDPEKYAPAYGGYCAFAVTQGLVAGVDPHVWKIVDGRLFLNNNADAAIEWNKDLQGSIASGDANWRAAF